MPGARSFRSTVQSIPSAAWTDIVATGTRWNDEAMWSAANPSRLTATASGLHIVSAATGFAADVAQAQSRMWAVTNGAGKVVAAVRQAPGPGESTAAPCTLVNAVAGNWWVASLFQNTAGALNTAVGGGPYAADFGLTRLPSGLLAARRESSVAQSIPTGVWTPLTFNTTNFDAGLGIPASTAQLVAPSDGTYAIFAGAGLGSAGVVSTQSLSIWTNSGGVGFIAVASPGITTSSWQAWNVTQAWPLVAGAVVQALIYQDTGNARNTDASLSYLAMVRLGP